MGGGDAPQRDIYSEITSEVGARARTMPGILGAEAQYRPEYANLDLQNIGNILYGQDNVTTPELQQEQYMGPSTYTYVDSKTGKPTGGQIQMTPDQFAALGPLQAANLMLVTPGTMQTRYTTKNVTTAGAPGLLDMQAKTRTAQIANLQSSDPETASLLERMTQNAQTGVDMGSRLNPAQMRNVQQTIRSRQAGTVLQNGNAGAYDEALGVSQYGDQLQEQRNSDATSTLGVRNSQFADPTAQAYGISSAGGPKLFGSTINANDLFSSNQNAAASSSAASANNNTALIGAGITTAATVAVIA